jgi:hypothetical protein
MESKMESNDTTRHPLVERLLALSKTLEETYAALRAAEYALARSCHALNEHDYARRLKKAAGSARLDRVVEAQHRQRCIHYAASVNALEARRPYGFARVELEQLLVTIGAELPSLDQLVANELADHVLQITKRSEWLSVDFLPDPLITRDQQTIAHKAIELLYKKFLQGEGAGFFEDLPVVRGRGYKSVNNSVLADSIEETQSFLRSQPGDHSVGNSFRAYLYRKAEMYSPEFLTALESALLKRDTAAVAELNIKERRAQAWFELERRHVVDVVRRARAALTQLKEKLGDAQSDIESGLQASRHTNVLELMLNVLAADSVIRSLEAKVSEVESRLAFDQITVEVSSDAPIAALKDLIASSGR